MTLCHKCHETHDAKHIPNEWLKVIVPDNPLVVFPVVIEQASDKACFIESFVFRLIQNLNEVRETFLFIRRRPLSSVSFQPLQVHLFHHNWTLCVMLFRDITLTFKVRIYFFLAGIHWDLGLVWSECHYFSLSSYIQGDYLLCIIRIKKNLIESLDNLRWWLQ